MKFLSLASVVAATASLLGSVSAQDRFFGEPCNENLTCSSYQPGTSDALSCSSGCGVCMYSGEIELPIPEDPAASGRTVFEACGLTSVIQFSTWVRNEVTTHPVLYPSNDDELRTIITTAKENDCKVRPTGTGHSMFGIVASTEGDNIIVVSLAEYVPGDEDWVMKLDESDPDEAKLRIAGGRTLLDAYTAIRPWGYFLPTQGAYAIFSVAGVIANNVHGADGGKSFMHAYVTRMRVMYSDGSVAVIDDESDLRMWRGGFGLGGFITAAEFKLEKRPNFLQGGVTLNITSWEKTIVEAEVQRIRDTTSSQLFFLNPFYPELQIAAFTYTNDVGDGNVVQKPPQALQGTYQFFQASQPQLPYTGMVRDLGDANNVQSAQAAICGLHEQGAQIAIASFSTTNNEQTGAIFASVLNDGFLLGEQLVYSKEVSYIFPEEDFFEVLDALKELFAPLPPSGPYARPNTAFPFRFLTVSNTHAELTPGAAEGMEERKMVAIEMNNMEFPGVPFDHTSMMMAEKMFRTRFPSSFPHTGKAFGFGIDDAGIVEPFEDQSVIESIYSTSQKKAFLDYVKKIDPTGVFFAGEATQFLGGVPTSEPTPAPSTFNSANSFSPTAAVAVFFLGAATGILF